MTTKSSYLDKISKLKIGARVRRNGLVSLGDWNDIRTIIGISHCRGRIGPSSISPCYYCIGKVVLNDNVGPRYISSGFKLGLDIIEFEDFLKEEEFEI